MEPQEDIVNKRTKKDTSTHITDFNIPLSGIGRPSHPKITTQDFIISLSITDRTTGKKINKEKNRG